METPPDEQSQQPAPPDDQAIDQAAIDALLSGATEDAESSGTETTESPGELQAASGQEAAPAPEASQGVSQADIDALLGATGTGPSEQPPDTAAPPPEPDTRVDTLGRPFDEAAAAMEAAIAEEKATAEVTDRSVAETGGPADGAPPPDTKPFELSEFTTPTNPDIDAKRVTMLSDVNLRVKIELGRTRMLVEDVLDLGEGSVVELDKLAGDPVDVYVNERLIARGEVLVLNDNFCVRISEVLSHDPHRVSA